MYEQAEMQTASCFSLSHLIEAWCIMQHEIINKLNKFVPVHSDVLMMAILRLLHNLSFDGGLRADMVAAGLVPKLVDLMAQPRYCYANLPEHVFVSSVKITVTLMARLPVFVMSKFWEQRLSVVLVAPSGNGVADSSCDTAAQALTQGKPVAAET